MTKILLIAIAFAAAFWLLRSHRRRADRHAQKAPEAQAEDMVDCAHCGLHLPRGESVVSGPRHFCCAEHQQQFRPER